jgi:hypothetical protein
MPTPTYKPLATVTLGASASSVTFASIPATYRDLIVVASALAATADSNVILRLNGDATSGNYFRVTMNGTGSITTSSTGTPQYVTEYAYMTTTTRVIIQTHFLDASATDKHKTYLTRADNSATGTMALAHSWSNTAAITSIALLGDASNFAAGSTFSLYGVIA